jgi:NAD-dependent dihydropyrimidine dehydrogenase PreA subunit
MNINQEKCVGCGLCVKYCSTKALSIVSRKAVCDQEKCTECNNCYRSKVCRTDALEPAKLEWPRTVRSQLSDIKTEYRGIFGRGTEEMKTNDVTGRYKPGYVGVAIELGRPNLGAYFRDVEYMAKAVAKLGVEFEERNPVTSYMNPETGEINPEILNECVISAILEFSIPLDKLDAVLDTIMEAAQHLDTVFSLDVCGKVDEATNTVPFQSILDKKGIFYRPNCKNNVGLGRPSYQF